MLQMSQTRHCEGAVEVCSESRSQACSGNAQACAQILLLLSSVAARAASPHCKFALQEVPSTMHVTPTSALRKRARTRRSHPECSKADGQAINLWPPFALTLKMARTAAQLVAMCQRHLESESGKASLDSDLSQRKARGDRQRRARRTAKRRRRLSPRVSGTDEWAGASRATATLQGELPTGSPVRIAMHGT